MTITLAWSAFAPATAQSVIKILRFDKNAGTINQGKEAGVRVGDIFEVNRYAGDFVYWVGRVEVVAVKPKIAGVKTLVLADNAQIQPGDILELHKREPDPALEKPRQAAPTAQKNDPTRLAPPSQTAPVDRAVAAKPWRRDHPIMLGFSSGILQPLSGPSQSLGLNLTIQVVDPSNNQTVRQMDVSRAYAASYTLHAFGSLPVSPQFAVNLGYTFTWLNVKNAVESSLLNIGAKASGSLMQIAAALNWRLHGRFQAEAGVGLFLPQLTVRGGYQTITISERHWGVTANASYLIPLGAAVWLKPVLGYNMFWDEGPNIHYLTLQIGPSFAIGKP